MRRFLHALLLLCLTATGAYAQTGTAKDKSAVSTEIGANFPDNTTGLITPLITRNSLQDFLSSWQNQRRVNNQTGTTYTFLNDDNGKLVKFGNAAAVAVTLPQATTAGFVAWESVSCNTGAGIVTITPTTSTINGNTTQTLTNGSCISIVSDGTNYQTELYAFQPTVNAQTGTTYTIAVSDYGNMVTFNNAGAIAVTLPQATGAFRVFSFWACSIGAGNTTITPTTSTINGSANVVLATNACIYVVSDGTNYRYTTASSPGKPTTSLVTAASHSGGFAANGSGTYTTPAGATWIEIHQVGGGAGGGADGAGTSGGNGNASCWNTSGAACTTPVYQSGGGSGGTNGNTGTGGAGGTIAGSGTCSWGVGGGSGGGESSGASLGGIGGSSTLGGAGAKQFGTGAPGESAQANTGSGGQGAPGGSNVGGGGGAGATCYVIIVAPAATYTYVAGAGGAGGTGGTNNGGAGASGRIFVIEHYGS